MSALEPATAAPGTGALKLAALDADIVEVSAYVAGAADARRRVGGIELPAFGRLIHAGPQLVLSVRPGRWLMLSAPQEPGRAARTWAAACANQGAVVDLSSALTPYWLTGVRAREVLTRGCRLDLAGQALPGGSAAATVIAQVAVILAALPSGLLLLSPSSTARHLREWLVAAARPFGIAPEVAVSFAEVCGERPL